MLVSCPSNFKIIVMVKHRFIIWRRQLLLLLQSLKYDKTPMHEFGVNLEKLFHFRDSVHILLRSSPTSKPKMTATVFKTVYIQTHVAYLWLDMRHNLFYSNLHVKIRTSTIQFQRTFHHPPLFHWLVVICSDAIRFVCTFLRDSFAPLYEIPTTPKGRNKSILTLIFRRWNKSNA